MRYILLLFLAITLFSCSSNESTEEPNSSYVPGEEIVLFSGDYLIAKKDENDGSIILEENCWTKSLDQFELNNFAGSPENYYFAFHGHHSYLYQLTNCEAHGDTLYFEGYPDENEELNIEKYKLFKIQQKAWKLVSATGEYILVKKEDEKNYNYVACIEEEEKQELSEMYISETMVQLLYLLKDGKPEIANHIPEKGILMSTLNVGGSKFDTLRTKDEILATALFETPVYERLMNYVQQHMNEELYFISIDETLPDRCDPEDEKIFLKFDDLDNESRFSSFTAMFTKRNDEKNEVYTYMIMKFYFENEIMYIESINNLDCES